MSKLLKLQAFPYFLSEFCSKLEVFSKLLKFQVFLGFQVKWQPCKYQTKCQKTYTIKFEYIINGHKLLQEFLIVYYSYDHSIV